MFKIEDAYKQTKVPKTVRFTKDIMNQLLEISQKNDVSFNLLVLECCKYALDNLEDEKK